MTSEVDYHANFNYWSQGEKWKGFFFVVWLILKDVPNKAFRHIINEYNEGKPITSSRDTQEIHPAAGMEALKIFKEYPRESSILDDFAYFEKKYDNQIKNYQIPPESPQQLLQPQINNMGMNHQQQQEFKNLKNPNFNNFNNSLPKSNMTNNNTNIMNSYYNQGGQGGPGGQVGKNINLNNSSNNNNNININNYNNFNSNININNFNNNSNISINNFKNMQNKNQSKQLSFNQYQEESFNPNVNNINNVQVKSILMNKQQQQEEEDNDFNNDNK